MIKKRVEKETLNRPFFSAPLKEEKAFIVSKSSTDAPPRRNDTHTDTHTHRERAVERS